MERIDKIISKELNIGRNDAKSLIKSGKVFLNGSSVKSPSEKLDEEKDVLTVGGRVIHLRRFVIPVLIAGIIRYVVCIDRNLLPLIGFQIKALGYTVIFYKSFS